MESNQSLPRSVSRITNEQTSNLSGSVHPKTSQLRQVLEMSRHPDNIRRLLSFFSPTELGKTYIEENWTLKEMVGELVHIARSGADKERLRAISMLNDLNGRVISAMVSGLLLDDPGEILDLAHALPDGSDEERGDSLPENGEQPTSDVFNDLFVPHLNRKEEIYDRIDEEYRDGNEDDADDDATEQETVRPQEAEPRKKGDDGAGGVHLPPKAIGKSAGVPGGLFSGKPPAAKPSAAPEKPRSKRRNSGKSGSKHGPANR